MARILSVDTCFLIDLEREQRRREEGPAHGFLKAHLDWEFHLSVVAYGEFAAGFAKPDDLRLGVVRDGYELMEIDARTADVYAAVYRDLRERKCLIGANDLWIASHSLQHGLPLVTRNGGEFSRVAGLEVMGY